MEQQRRPLQEPWKPKHHSVFEEEQKQKRLLAVAYSAPPKQTPGEQFAVAVAARRRWRLGRHLRHRISHVFYQHPHPQLSPKNSRRRFLFVLSIETTNCHFFHDLSAAAAAARERRFALSRIDRVRDHRCEPCSQKLLLKISV